MEKLSKKEFIDFTNKVIDYLIYNKYCRAGQAAFNVLYKERPDLAVLVYASPNADPFHNDKNIDNFFLAILSPEALEYRKSLMK